MSFRTCWGRDKKFLVAGEQEIIHTKRFFFPVVSAATCTDHHLEVDQRALVSTLLALVSTHCPRTAQKVFWEVRIVFTIEERGSVDRLTFVVTLGCHASLLFRSLDPFFVEETRSDTTCCPIDEPRGGVNGSFKII
ncbi:hypothetical protein Taro_032667 [Colocasia esculenta]|uniref:Uncharacterized protein n=1 Tax=Colocasia esculenta TaxID=4460 RepID=A0A843VXY0_COLES|nr:hypothetical protein [Colocasia esculenta]